MVNIILHSVKLTMNLPVKIHGSKFPPKFKGKFKIFGGYLSILVVVAHLGSFIFMSGIVDGMFFLRKTIPQMDTNGPIYQ